MAKTVRLAYLVSHPIQYQAPMLRRIAAEPGIDLKVFFCSDISVRAYRDEGFGHDVAWDVPLLDGYDHEFLPAIGSASVLGQIRPYNYGLARALRRGRFDVLWVHGYMRSYHMLSMACARRMGIVVLNRDEAWAKSAERGKLKNAIKRPFYAAMRRICHGWLTIGTANRDYYLANGMAPETVFSMPYAVDNDWFRSRAETAAASREALRAELGLAPGRPIVLYASKFIARKKPDDLLEAYAAIAREPALRDPALLFVGDGEMRPALEAKVAALGLDGVRFAGFRNQSALPGFYDLCDVFVLPSRLEPWGLVINEVMNAGRAVIASDEVGGAIDLVRDGENGFVFPAGDVAALADRLRRILGDPALCRNMGERSRVLIDGWSFREDVEGLRRALDYFVPRIRSGRR